MRNTSLNCVEYEKSFFCVQDLNVGNYKLNDHHFNTQRRIGILFFPLQNCRSGLHLSLLAFTLITLIAVGANVTMRTKKKYNSAIQYVFMCVPIWVVCTNRNEAHLYQQFLDTNKLKIQYRTLWGGDSVFFSLLIYGTKTVSWVMT